MKCKSISQKIREFIIDNYGKRFDASEITIDSIMADKKLSFYVSEKKEKKFKITVEELKRLKNE